jgi:hypothetical protein
MPTGSGRFSSWISDGPLAIAAKGSSRISGRVLVCRRIKSSRFLALTLRRVRVLLAIVPQIMLTLKAQ